MEVRAARSCRLPDQEMWERIRDNSRTRRVARFVMENYRMNIPLKLVAEIACMERTAFARHFAVRTGITFGGFLRGYRVQMALYFMKSQDLSLSAVRDLSGFKSRAAFHRAFRSALGNPPSYYRTRVPPSYVKSLEALLQR